MDTLGGWVSTDFSDVSLGKIGQAGVDYPVNEKKL